MKEELAYDPTTGRMLNSNHLNYRIPTAADDVYVQAALVEVPSSLHPYGIRGIGEPGLNTTVPAIANTIYNAIGIRFYEFPITPAKVLKALGKA